MEHCWKSARIVCVYMVVYYCLSCILRRVLCVHNDDDGRKVICLTHHSRLERCGGGGRQTLASAHFTSVRFIEAPRQKRDLWGAACVCVCGFMLGCPPMEAVCIIWGYMRAWCVRFGLYLFIRLVPLIPWWWAMEELGKSTLDVGQTSDELLARCASGYIHEK